jgi:hypothetical protein
MSSDTSVVRRQVPLIQGDDGLSTGPPPPSNGTALHARREAADPAPDADSVPARAEPAAALHYRLLEAGERDRLRALEVVTNPRAE